MLKNLIKIKIFVCCLVAVACFSTCKKYPENSLWFKRPDIILARGKDKPWKLESYTVNDIDSTSEKFLKVWKDEGLAIYIDGKVRTGTDKFYCLDILEGGWAFFDHKKVIIFRFGNGNFKPNSNSNSIYTNQRNVFINSGQRWQILKLTKEKFWLLAEYNMMKYELHFK